jgi:hypothetical protein
MREDILDAYEILCHLMETLAGRRRMKPCDLGIGAHRSAESQSVALRQPACGHSSVSESCSSARRATVACFPLGPVTVPSIWISPIGLQFKNLFSTNSAPTKFNPFGVGKSSGRIVSVGFTHG